MESEEKAQVTDLPKKNSPGERSRIEFPYADLESSIAIVSGVHQIGGTACEYEQLAAHLGLEAKGGGFRIRVLSAKTFGLLTSERGGRITLTDLGREIIDPQTDKHARIQAFLAVELFEKVFNNFKGRPLPPIAGLERALGEFGVGAKVVKNARQVLMRSAKQAGYFELSADRLTTPASRAGQFNHEHAGIAPPKRGGGNGGGGDESNIDLHPFIEGLLKTLPKPETDWPIAGRVKWLQAASHVFDLIYSAEDESSQGEMTTIDIKINKMAK